MERALIWPSTMTSRLRSRSLTGGREDRVHMLVDVAREEARKAAAEGEPLGSVALSTATLREALNAGRRQFCGLDGKPLAPLSGKAFGE